MSEFESNLEDDVDRSGIEYVHEDGTPETEPSEPASTEASEPQDTDDEEVPPDPEPIVATPATDVPATMRGGFPIFQGELPPDIERVWGAGKLDGMGQP